MSSAEAVDGRDRAGPAATAAASGDAPRIFCISLVKDEGDVIEECFAAASVWAHRIFVFDNGSTDGTWETVQRIAARDPTVVPFKQDPKTFDDNLRQEVFAAYRHLAADGDWWCILDADEFYHDDPRRFLAAVPRAYQGVWNIQITFGLTEADVERFERDPSLYENATSVRERIRHYRAMGSEVRFIRHDAALRWPEGQRHPFFGALYPTRILTLHYPQRSPRQLQRRIRIRRDALARGSVTFRHEERAPENWRDRLAQPEVDGFHRYDGDGRFVVDPAALRPLPFQTRLPPRLVNAARNLKGFFRVFVRKRQARR